MLLPSEIEAKSLIPAVRAILAKKLIREYSLKEEDVAKVLGITQAAVSNYVRGTRGDIGLISKLESVREVMRMIDDIAEGADFFRSRFFRLPRRCRCPLACAVTRLARDVDARRSGVACAQRAPGQIGWRCLRQSTCTR